jgi:carbohydrate-selective porin OprB
VTQDLGVFSRLGWNDGHTEAWAYTPIDRTASLGMLLKGRLWRRPDDKIGVARAYDGIAQDHRAYLAAGGLDFNVGDGKLNYGLEKIWECFYSFSVTKNIFITYDFQYVNNPAYNRDRGPVAVNTLRVHAEF